MKIQKNIPHLRFPEFEGEWGKINLGKIAKRKIIKNTQNTVKDVFTNSATQGVVNQRDYFDKDIANQNNLTGYYIVEEDDFIYNPRISTSAPVGPLSRNHIGLGIMSPLYSVFKISQGNLDFFETYFSTTKWHQYLKGVANYGVRADRMNLTNDDFYDMPLFVPTLCEQQKIASFFTILYQKISQLKQKKSLLEQYRKGIMQKIFSQEIRFKDKNGQEFPKWEKKKLGEVLYEHLELNNGNKYSEVFSVAKQKGVINQIEHLGRSFSAKDIAHYKVIFPNDIVYTKSPTSEFPFGIIKQNLTDRTGVVSPLYGVFKPKTKSLGFFLHNYFLSWKNTYNYLNPIVQKGAKNTMNINNKTFLNGAKINLPTSEQEQAKIANFLSALNDKINHTEKQIEKAEAWEKGLLQQMFV